MPAVPCIKCVGIDSSAWKLLSWRISYGFRGTLGVNTGTMRLLNSAALLLLMMICGERPDCAGCCETNVACEHASMCMLPMQLSLAGCAQLRSTYIPAGVVPGIATGAHALNVTVPSCRTQSGLKLLAKQLYTTYDQVSVCIACTGQACEFTGIAAASPVHACCRATHKPICLPVILIAHRHAR